MSMTGAHAGLERRVLGDLETAPSRIPVILGGCGTGRTSLLNRVRELTPGVEFSPYVTRVLNLAEKAESARLAEVA